MEKDRANERNPDSLNALVHGGVQSQDLLSADLVYMCVCFQGKAGQKMDACCVWLLMERGSWVCEEV